MSNAFPAFGDILNEAIQIIKSSGNKKAGISQKVFFGELSDKLGLIEKQLELSYIDPLLENSEVDCTTYLFLICLNCLEAIGIIKENKNSLIINSVSDNFLDLVAFNEKVTSDNLIKIDPFGKIFFWLTVQNFSNIRTFHAKLDDENYYISNLNRLEKISFCDWFALQKICYGENGDPLLNFLIKETMRRTSVFMNNYANATLLNDFEKATHNTILKKITKLTPTQFEHLCLQVVKQSLINEDPNTAITIEHTGKTNDWGIDGKVTQIFENGETHYYYIQAKLYQNNNKISNRDLRNFVGAYPPNPKFHHGIFITTSDYTANAVEYKDSLTDHNLILINQITLLELMIAHEVGVETVKTEAMVLNKEFYRTLPK